ncbi:uncharacterized protein LOC123544671 [Mercenaria mercenaria]|uniref:uncharacterized protein LOC123544671 n=1 Tax=Mercenaria mercenaria TaxID=6596 RepID=UPI00234E8C46|nr:uncharacterized protein LOC123544671 [Mercenaria mercenaria]
MRYFGGSGDVIFAEFVKAEDKTKNMEPPASKKPRVRAKNFSMSEVEVLKTAVTDNFSTISAKHCNGTGGITKKIQDKAWATICEKVNSVGNAKRSVAEVKEKWRNLTKKAKTETTMQKVSMQKTGGGPPAPLPDPLLDDIAGLFCSSASFHGIPGATDCETVTISLRLDEEDAYADEIPSMVINAEELQKVDEISSAAKSAAPIQGSRASAAPCPSSSTSDRGHRKVLKSYKWSSTQSLYKMRGKSSNSYKNRQPYAENLERTFRSCP